MINATNKVSQ